MEERETAHDAEEFKNEMEIKKPQLVINLPKGTRPSSLTQLIKHMERGNDEHCLSEFQLDLVMAKRMIRIIDFLKMRPLERHTIINIILP